jgi:hypothetical protein
MPFALYRHHTERSRTICMKSSIIKCGKTRPDRARHLNQKRIVRAVGTGALIQTTFQMEILKLERQSMDTYRSSDLHLIAFLKARGMRMKHKERVGRKLIFIFDDSDELKNLVYEFHNDNISLNVNANAYKNAIQDLKTMIFNS